MATGGNFTIDGQVLKGRVLQNTSEVIVTADSGAAYTIDLTLGNVFDITLTGNVTFTFPSGLGGNARSFTLKLTQDGTGGYAITWPASARFPGGNPPTLTTTAGALAVLTVETSDGGTTWDVFLAGDDIS